MPIYLQHGNLIDYVPPTDTSTEDVVFMGGLVGIPQTFIPAGELGALSVDGVYMFTKKEGVTVTLGDVVKYCGTTKLAQDSNADLTLGVAVADAEADSLGVKVKINSVLPTDGGGGGGGSGDIEIAVNCGLAFGEQGELFVNINTNGGLAFNSNGELVTTGGGGSGGDGIQNLATGEGSLSILGEATSSDYSTSVGYFAEATGCGSTAIGKYTAAYGDYSVVLGGGAATGSSSIAVGGGSANGDFSIAIGDNASTSGESTIAIGDNANAFGKSSIAIGDNAEASVDYSTAIGNYANASDIGVTVISAAKTRNDSGTKLQRTQLYLIGAGSTMSTTYCDGEAGLGFVFEDSDGEIVKRGTIKLSALMTENTDTFEPSDW